MTPLLRRFLDTLSSNHWQVDLKQTPHLVLDSSMQARHLDIPADYLEFLHHVSSCVNADKTAWFLCEDDYNGNSDSAFAWNEWELLSLNGLTEESDDAQSVIRFWNTHLPFMQSVRTGYSYLAFNKIGRVVYGFEPGFEESSEICTSFQEFIPLMTEAISSKKSVFGIRDFTDANGKENL